MTLVVLDIPARLPWMDDALCAQVDTEIFFPEKGGTTKPAKAVCSRCPVKEPCLADAIEHHERYGVRGGKSERERRALIAERRTA